MFPSKIPNTELKEQKTNKLKYKEKKDYSNTMTCTATFYFKYRDPIIIEYPNDPAVVNNENRGRWYPIRCSIDHPPDWKPDNQIRYLRWIQRCKDQRK
jgi:hypothetical protein